MGLFCALIGPVQALSGQPPGLDEQQLRWLGERIFVNECGGRERCLTSWNAGEQFPSLGIGHFIWYPAGYSGPFVETFPALIAHFQENGVPLPAWLLETDGAPWPDRDTFLAAMDSAGMKELRGLLAATRELQTRFIVDRFHDRLARLHTGHPAMEGEAERAITTLVERDPPHGIYALIDYVHFKGWGVAESERYQGEGWGLAQVLAEMHGEDMTLENFVAAAERVLRRRVALAPRERNERRWLDGWLNRVRGYLPPKI